MHDDDDRVDVVRRQPALDVAQHELLRLVGVPVGTTEVRRGVGRGDDAVVVADDGEPAHPHKVRVAAARIRTAPVRAERRREVAEMADLLDARDVRLLLDLLEADALAHADEVADRLHEDGAFRHRGVSLPTFKVLCRKFQLSVVSHGSRCRFPAYRTLMSKVPYDFLPFLASNFLSFPSLPGVELKSPG